MIPLLAHQHWTDYHVPEARCRRRVIQNWRNWVDLRRPANAQWVESDDSAQLYMASDDAAGTLGTGATATFLSVARL
jgi:hypothetical protein